MHYLDKEKVTRQPVHESSRPGHRDGHEMKESVETSCYDEGVQMRASKGGLQL